MTELPQRQSSPQQDSGFLINVTEDSWVMAIYVGGDSTGQKLGVKKGLGKLPISLNEKGDNLVLITIRIGARFTALPLASELRLAPKGARGHFRSRGYGKFLAGLATMNM